jgi:hypothetical protein
VDAVRLGVEQVGYACLDQAPRTFAGAVTVVACVVRNLD